MESYTPWHKTTTPGHISVIPPWNATLPNLNTLSVQQLECFEPGWTELSGDPDVNRPYDHSRDTNRRAWREPLSSRTLTCDPIMPNVFGDIVEKVGALPVDLAHYVVLSSLGRQGSRSIKVSSNDLDTAGFVTRRQARLPFLPSSKTHRAKPAADSMVLCTNISPQSTVRDSMERCTICLDTEPLQGVNTIPCGHSFHTQRLGEWFRHCNGRPACPLCRQQPDLAGIQTLT